MAAKIIPGSCDFVMARLADTRSGGFPSPLGEAKLREDEINRQRRDHRRVNRRRVFVRTDVRLGLRRAGHPHLHPGAGSFL